MDGATPSRSVRVHLIYREGRKPPESLLAARGPQCALEPPSEPHMCAECEDDAEGEIVLDTARGRAYYSILRQARKRLSEPRGATPQAGTLRTGYWTDGITFYYQLASEASAGRTLRSWLPRIYNFFFFFMSRSRDGSHPALLQRRV